MFLIFFILPFVACGQSYNPGKHLAAGMPIDGRRPIYDTSKSTMELVLRFRQNIPITDTIYFDGFLFLFDTNTYTYKKVARAIIQPLKTQ